MNEWDSKGVNRRALLLAAAGAAPLLAVGTNGAKAAKLPQAAVAYQDSPKNGQQCDNCGVFIAPNSCKTVTGVVSPTGWCKIWVKKA